MPADELVVLTEAAAQTIDPRYLVGAYDFKLSRLVFAPLVSVDDERVEPKMELAESVAADGEHRWLVALREARFSDGRRVTAADVVYTLDRLRDPDTGSQRLRKRFADDGLERVEVVDDHHLVFELSHPHAPFITDLDFGIFARPTAGSPPHGRGELPIGAGPFVPSGREGETFHFVRNEHYYGGSPRIRALTVRTIRDDNSRLLALVGGSADLTQNTISPLLLPAVEEQAALHVESGKSSVYSYLGFNLDDPILKDPRVRRAIALAIDRAQIVRTKLRGHAVLATGMLPTFHWAYAGPPQVPDWTYDPAEARRLLDEAGFPDPPGPQPRMTLVYKTSSNKFRVAIARVIAAMLADVGIEIDLRTNEFATFFADIKAGNFQLFSMQIPEIAEPDLYTNFFASDRIPSRDRPDVGGNRMRYRNAEVDRLLTQGRAELDRERRRVIYAQVQRILAEELPVVSLWHEDNIAAMRREVTGFTILPTAQLSTLAQVDKHGRP